MYTHIITIRYYEKLEAKENTKATEKKRICKKVLESSHSLSCMYCLEFVINSCQDLHIFQNTAIVFLHISI